MDATPYEICFGTLSENIFGNLKSLSLDMMADRQRNFVPPISPNFDLFSPSVVKSLWVIASQCVINMMLSEVLLFFRDYRPDKQQVHEGCGL